MRKTLLTLLLAAATAAPASAQPAGGDDGAPSREERRAERAEARAQVRERMQARQERTQVRQAPAEVLREHVDRARVRIERTERAGAATESDFAPGERAMEHHRSTAEVERVRNERVLEAAEPDTAHNPLGRNINPRGRPTLGQQQTGDSVADWRHGEREDLVERRVRDRSFPGRVTPPVGARPDRPAPPPQTVAHRDRHPHWRSDWRHDRRYDWRDHRRRHRSLFHLGFYFDPFGWRYHRYGIGWRMWPSYYDMHYWLQDPWTYRLPYAPWPYKWVRYYDDALLINIRTGRVVDVIYNVFW